MTTARTTNLACALFLFQRGNRLTGIDSFVDLPYCHDECRFSFEGEQAEADWRYFISHNMSDLDFARLPLLFRAVEGVLPVQAVRV